MGEPEGGTHTGEEGNAGMSCLRCRVEERGGMVAMWSGWPGG